MSGGDVSKLISAVKDGLHSEWAVYKKSKKVKAKAVCPYAIGGQKDTPIAALESISAGVREWEECLVSTVDPTVDRARVVLPREVMVGAGGQVLLHPQRRHLPQPPAGTSSSSRASSASKAEPRGVTGGIAVGGKVKNLPPKASLMVAVEQSANYMLDHVKRMSEDAYISGNNQVLFMCLASAALVRSRLNTYKDILKQPTTKNLTAALGRCGEVVEFMMQNILSYNCDLLSLLLHDAASHDWLSPKPYMEAARCSLTLQIWSFYMQAITAASRHLQELQVALLQPQVALALLQPQVALALLQLQVALALLQPQVALTLLQPQVALALLQPQVALTLLQPQVALALLQPQVALALLQPQVALALLQPQVALALLQPQVALALLQPQVALALLQPQNSIEQQNQQYRQEGRQEQQQGSTVTCSTLTGLRNDLWRYTSPRISESILASIFTDTLSLMVTRYMQIEMSDVRVSQYCADVVAVLVVVASFLPSLLPSPVMLFCARIHESVALPIHRRADLLLKVAALKCAPIENLARVFQKGFDNAVQRDSYPECVTSIESTPPWLSFLNPSLFPRGKASLSFLGDPTAVYLTLLTAASRPQPQHALIVRGLLMRQFLGTKIILRGLQDAPGQILVMSVDWAPALCRIAGPGIKESALWDSLDRTQSKY
ncbi:hypothetical protein GWK47_002897 [Chionoecetes opilio]|uniref:Uncharacterized protein n=1 Tax=Chionoecetes opilio TaxID=41210 RepID=A0A8J4XPA0_CHIOP|nr:hypothetical protein GWK47_002897 [Chionoecetes opilio]